MIPQQVLSTTPARSSTLYPDNAVRETELEDFELGGVALQDPSQGIKVRAWKGVIDRETFVATVTPVDSPSSSVVLFTETETPVEFTFCFDLSMAVYTAVRFADGRLRFRWFDTAVQAYTITEYSDIQSVMLGFDDKRPVNSDNADVIFTYIKVSDNRLYFRAQRDRFLVEYSLTDSLGPNMRITNFGMGRNNRLQWRIAVRRVL